MRKNSNIHVHNSNATGASAMAMIVVWFSFVGFYLFNLYDVISQFTVALDNNATAELGAFFWTQTVCIFLGPLGSITGLIGVLV